MANQTTLELHDLPPANVQCAEWRGADVPDISIAQVFLAHYLNLTPLGRVSVPLTVLTLLVIAWFGYVGALPTILLGLAVAIYSYAHNRNFLYGYRGSYERFLEDEGHIVRLRLLRNGLVYGDDAGTVRFLQGSFVFEGIHTRLSLPISHVFATGVGYPTRFVTRWPEAHFILIGDHTQLNAIEFEPLHPAEFALEAASQLRTDFDSWLKSRSIKRRIVLLPPRKRAPFLQPRHTEVTAMKLLVPSCCGLLLLVSGAGRQVRGLADLSIPALVECIVSSIFFMWSAVVIQKYRLWHRALSKVSLR